MRPWSYDFLQINNCCMLNVLFALAAKLFGPMDSIVTILIKSKCCRASNWVSLKIRALYIFSDLLSVQSHFSFPVERKKKQNERKKDLNGEHLNSSAQERHVFVPTTFSWWQSRNLFFDFFTAIFGNKNELPNKTTIHINDLIFSTHNIYSQVVVVVELESLLI